MMKSGIQDFFAAAGEEACYVFCLGHVAEEFLNSEINPWTLFMTGIESGAVYFNRFNFSDKDNFFVRDPEKLLFDLTRLQWDVRHAPTDYKPRHNEYTIQRWERVATGRVWAHFRRPDWDPLIDSQTVRHGRIVSQRICKVAG